MPASNTRKPAPRTPTTIRIHNRQQRWPISKRRLAAQAEEARRLLRREWPAALEEVDILFVTPALSAKIHREFFNDPSSTDVMTFEHGEIFICPSVAEKQRRDSGLSLHDELLTYLIHGLLHLCGWNDLSEAEFNAMARKQDQIRKKLSSF